MLVELWANGVSDNDANGNFRPESVGFFFVKGNISVKKEGKCISHHCGEPGNDDNRDNAPCCIRCKCDRLAVLSWVTHVLECVIAFMVL